MTNELPQVTIYSDGACIGNPGPGGYGAVLLHGGKRKEISGGFRRTTNNRMELLGAIEALELLTRPCAVTLYTDSQYVCDSVSKGWAARWRANGWIRNKKKDFAINHDLWGRLLDLCATHAVTFRWVRGHSGIKENERCDQLAMQAALNNPSQVDEPYESGEALRPPESVLRF